MIARDLISDSVPSVKTSDTAGRVMDWLNEFKVEQLPVVNNELLLGMVTEDDLLDCDGEDTPVGDIRLELPSNIFVFDDSHFYDCLRLASTYHLDIVPVINPKNNVYLGVVTKKDIVVQVGRVLGVNEPGGIIVLEIPANGYSLSEIGRICESNDVKVISLSVDTTPDGSSLFVTLKVNAREMSRLFSTFERFEYKVAFVLMADEEMDQYKERYENLMRYLDI